MGFGWGIGILRTKKLTQPAYYVPRPRVFMLYYLINIRQFGQIDTWAGDRGSFEHLRIPLDQSHNNPAIILPSVYPCLYYFYH